MAVNRIEVAIDCDEPLEEGLDVLAAIVGALGLNPETDVEAIVTASEEGEPLLVAVLVASEQESDRA